MKVSISIFGMHTTLNESMVEMDIPALSTVKELMTRFAFTLLSDPDLIIDKEGNLRKHLIIQVNKKRVMTGKAADYVLNEGDKVTVYPSVSGG
ncbi:hypothetical protein MmiHf6_01430 [Methanimicrococcus hongohii]|uniref:MoaD/ThiS family protein n=1 Tax=Methanimicrococcus hongohii TaxID=3028295 RepID=A0AA96UZC7_9EURY|nr:MoaD/ThiS family protein [Methanimicrococcus sp. Hf6]WNY22858.1 hypothetical protein MmiHf6_01430 [Methanimicrococcus sp. Hf6]